MAYAVAEIDHDEPARVCKALATHYGAVAAALKNVRFEKIHERTFVERLRAHGRQSLDDAELERIKDLAWKYRRQLPAHLAPKLPPHDPIVREMEQQGR